MTKIDAPDRFATDGKDGADWTYGTSIERAMDAPPQDAQTLDDPQDDLRRGNPQAKGDAAADKRRDETSDDAGKDARRNRGENAADRTGKGPQGRPNAPDQDDPHGDPEHKTGSGKQPRETKADEPPPSPPRKLVFVVVGLVLLALLGWGAYSHWRRNSDAEATSNETRDVVPEVRTTEAKRDDKPIELTLPGQTEAFETANIFPRATGYITKRNVDIGSRVKKGDLLVHITAPDLDQQLAQAVAQLGQVRAAEAQANAQVTQAEANLNLAKVTLARTATLTQQGYETLQNRDNQVANQQSQQATVETARAGVNVALANTKAQQATVDRLTALTGFEDVIAPFDGVITTRNVDNGDLVNADTSSATPMFSIAREDVIRVTVQVPQNSSAGVKEGVPSSIEVPSSPGQHFSGTVTRSSIALLSSARTLDTEVDVPNPDGAIRPGLFVYVTMHIPRDHPEVVVPAESLIFNQGGMQIATVEGDQAKVHPVKIYRDFGSTVSLAEGLQGGEQIILSPPALLRDGSKVKVHKDTDDKKPDGKTGQPASNDSSKDASKPDAGKQG